MLLEFLAVGLLIWAVILAAIFGKLHDERHRRARAVHAGSHRRADEIHWVHW
jgi:hypothetical protein